MIISLRCVPFWFIKTLLMTKKLWCSPTRIIMIITGFESTGSNSRAGSPASGNQLHFLEREKWIQLWDREVDKKCKFHEICHRIMIGQPSLISLWSIKPRELMWLSAENLERYWWYEITFTSCSNLTKASQSFLIANDHDHYDQGTAGRNQILYLGQTWLTDLHRC